MVMLSGGASRSGPPTAGARATQPAPPPRYLTDSEGRFAFRFLTRGSYTITATKPGYSDGAHGRRRPGGPTRPILLDDGERLGDITIPIFKQGAIAGTVVDDAGEPLIGTQVRAYRRVLSAGRRILSQAGSATTDDRGAYRFGSLTPGEYVVSVPMTSTTMPTDFVPDSRTAPNFELTAFTPGGSGFSFGSGGQRVGPDSRFLLQTANSGASVVVTGTDGRMRASPTIYYPGTRAVDEAQVVKVTSGEEILGVDVAVPLLPAANISGQLLSPEGPASGYALHLVSADSLSSMTADVDVAAAVTAGDGSFMFLAVPAGQYILQTSRVPRPGPPPPPPPPSPPGAPANWTAVQPVVPQVSSMPMLWASMPVSLGESDINGLGVMLQEGLKVSGRVEFDGSAARPAAARLAQVPVIVESADARQRTNQSQPARLQPDGRFTTGGFLPGKYLLRIGGAPPGWTLRSAMLDGVDVSDVPFDLQKDVTNVVVTFTDRPTDVRGTVSMPSGQPPDIALVVFPSDSEAWKSVGVNPRRMRMTRVPPSGAFTLGALPPGDYFAVAFREEFLESPAEWMDPKFLEQLSRVAMRFSLGEGERKTVDVPFQDVRPGGGNDDRPGPVARAAHRPLDAPPIDSIEAQRQSGPFVPDEPAQQVRDRAVDPRIGSGSISGRVVLEGGTQPVRRARVSVMSNELRGARSSMTDDDGRFAIGGLPAGRYTLTVSKPAFLTSYFGARRVGRGPGTQIAVASGQHVADLVVPLQRGSAVSGMVLDSFGQPYPNARVSLMRFVTRDGERVLQSAAGSGARTTVTTDDRGSYRMYGIPPGNYAVSVAISGGPGSETRLLSDDEMNAALADLRSGGAKSTSTVSSGMQVTQPGRSIAPAPPGAAPPDTPPGGRALGYASVYYPGTLMQQEAGTITVGAGQEITGIDIPMRLVPTARVEGTLLGPDGQPATRATVSLVTTTGTGTSSYSMRMYPDGRFQALGVAPGTYTITARMMEQPVRPSIAPGLPPPAPIRIDSSSAPRLSLWAQQEASVNGEDITGLSLTLAEGMTVSGRVVFEGKTQKPTDPSTVRVSLEVLRPSAIGFSARPSQLDQNGNFSIEGVTPGRYRLSASVPGPQGTGTMMSAEMSVPASPTWALKSSIVNGHDSIDYPFEIQAGQHISGAVITLTDQITELSGSIVDGSGAPVRDLTVVLFPTDRSFWSTSSRRIRAPYRAVDGKFKMTPLLPGEYYLAVVTEIDPSEWGDPAFMEQLAAAAIRITLAEGEKKVQDVRVGG